MVVETENPFEGFEEFEEKVEVTEEVTENIIDRIFSSNINIFNTIH